MPEKELRTFDRYRYGKRSFLYSGDRFRTSGGPFYLTKDDDGQRIRIPMNEPAFFGKACNFPNGASFQSQARKMGS